MRIAIKIGGSVIASPINLRLIDGYAELLVELRRQGHDVAVVVGGGSTARKYMSNAGLRHNREAQDRIGVGVTRIVANMLLRRLGSFGGDSIATTPEEATKTVSSGRIAVAGGLETGKTTDAAAAQIAEKMRANLLVKATSVDGVYDRDPKEDGARLLTHIGFDELLKLLPEKLSAAGEHHIIDPAAARVIARCKIRTRIVNGFDPKNVIAAIDDENVGTLIDSKKKTPTKKARRNPRYE